MNDEKMIDWNRVTHLLKLGIIASIMVLAGDMLLGRWQGNCSGPWLS